MAGAVGPSRDVMNALYAEDVGPPLRNPDVCFARII